MEFLWSFEWFTWQCFDITNLIYTEIVLHLSESFLLFPVCLVTCIWHDFQPFSQSFNRMRKYLNANIQIDLSTGYDCNNCNWIKVNTVQPHNFTVWPTINLSLFPCPLRKECEIIKFNFECKKINYTSLFVIYFLLLDTAKINEATHFSIKAALNADSIYFEPKCQYDKSNDACIRTVEKLRGNRILSAVLTPTKNTYALLYVNREW